MKIIRIKVKLINMKTKEVVKNENKILLHLGLQTWEIPSNPILRNKTGRRGFLKIHLIFLDRK